MRRKIIIGLVALVVAILCWQLWKSLDGGHNRMVKVQKGVFETSIVVMGQLKAQEAMDINVPEVCSNDHVDIWALKIMSLVEEGKVVSKGDEVARLDPTEVEQSLEEVNDELKELCNQVEDAKIDSSIALVAARENIQKQRDRLMDAGIKVQQSSFESVAVQRQCQIEYEKASRSLEKCKRELILKTQKHKAKIARKQRKVNYLEYKKTLLEKLKEGLIIKSPADGMIIYGMAYNGQKIKVGARVGRWMPLIATLPDLKTIISEVYVREVDIAKIAVGQKVIVTIDAFPGSEFKGEITSVANIGQAMPGEFQNGFKVIVHLSDYAEKLLPGMTSTNTIITHRVDDALFVEKEAVRGNDSLRYVLKKKGLSVFRQQVLIDDENELYYSIRQGVKEGDMVMLHYEGNPEEKELVEL